MFVAGIDGCRGGWVSFKVDLACLETAVELIDLPSILRNKPDDLAILAIDIPNGLLDCSRACDKAARKLLGRPRGTTVFPAPCRASLSSKNHAAATATNLRTTGKGLSQQRGVSLRRSSKWMTPSHRFVRSGFLRFIRRSASGLSLEDARWFTGKRPSWCQREACSASYCFPGD